MSKNIQKLSHKHGLENNLFDSIAKNVTDNENAIKKIAKKANLTPTIIKGSASFYDFLDTKPKKQKTFVCTGTACLLSGATTQLESHFPDAGKAVCCGYCYQGSGLLKHKNDGSLDAYHQSDEGLSQPEIPVYNLSGSAILTSPIKAIDKLYSNSVEKNNKILSQLKQSGLRGRGGAGFSFAIKCQATFEAQSNEKYIVCNADEGDPGAFSDRYLLEEQTHKVLAGMHAAALATGARSAVLYIRHEYPKATRRVEKAISEYESLLPKIKNDIRFYIINGVGSYVCGEETALLNSIEGRRPEVRVRPPYPATDGLWGKPTLLSNVETFANIPWILQQGGTTFASIGTNKSKGTKLISLDSQFVHPGIYEVDFGHSFSDLIFNKAGGFKTKIKALQVGGPLGSIIPVNAIHDLKLDFENFEQSGFALGHAGIIAIPESFLMIDFMRHIFSYMAEESCGKCNPCRLGTAKGSYMLSKATPDNPLDGVLFKELLELLESGSLCALGGGLPLPIKNAMKHFKKELSKYFSNMELKK